MDINVLFFAVLINPMLCVAIVAIFILSLSALTSAVRASTSASWNMGGVAVVTIAFLMSSLQRYSSLDFSAAWEAALLALGILGGGYAYYGRRGLRPSKAGLLQSSNEKFDVGH